MIGRSVTGLKIRETRRSLGLKQNELAKRVGISASYLNLIERNKRAIGGTLLSAIGRELSLSVDELDGSSERRLRDQLLTLAEDAAAGTPELRGEDVDAFIARHPLWARAAARIYSALLSAETEVNALSDRLTHDPVLAEAMHDMLTEITALRSTAEILADTTDIAPQQRRRFERIVDEQSSRLARTATSIAAHFDRISEDRRSRTAMEDAEEFLYHSNRSEAVEAIGRGLRAALDDERDLELALQDALKTAPSMAMDWSRTQRLAALAHALVCEVATGEIWTAIGNCPGPAKAAAAASLTRRVADAILLPATRLIQIGEALSWDIDAMTRATDGDSALVFRRIADLHDLGAPRAGLITADASGATLGRAGDLGLLPRKRQLDCPIWPLHRARPDTILRCDVLLPGGEIRHVVATAHLDGMTTDMLVFTSINPDSKPALAVGPGCRICSHANCHKRREPSIIGD